VISRIKQTSNVCDRECICIFSVSDTQWESSHIFTHRRTIVINLTTRYTCTKPTCLTFNEHAEFTMTYDETKTDRQLCEISLFSL